MQPNKEGLGLIGIERTGILKAVSVQSEMNSLFCFACWKAFLHDSVIVVGTKDKEIGPSPLKKKKKKKE